jgi:hypothetical protein
MLQSSLSVGCTCVWTKGTTVIFDHPQKAKMRAAAKALFQLFPFPATNNNGEVLGNSQVIMNGIGDSSRHAFQTANASKLFRHFQINIPGLITQQDGKVVHCICILEWVMVNTWIMDVVVLCIVLLL